VLKGLSRIVIGIGNPYRSDDGVGVVVARRLREAKPANCAVHEATGEGTQLMSLWEGAQHLILIDAVQSREPAGTIHRIDAAREHVPSDFFHYSTHAFSVAEAVEMAKVLNTLPPCVTLYGITGKTFAAGTQLSPEVQKAGERTLMQLLDELGRPAS